MLGRVVAVLVCLLILLGFLCRNLYVSLKESEEIRQTLQKSLEANIQAAKDKDKRSKDEIQRLQKQLTELHQIDDSCLDDNVNANLIKFMQQLQQNSADTISFTFTK